MNIFHDTEINRGVSNPPFTKTMKRTIKQLRQYYRKHRAHLRPIKKATLDTRNWPSAGNNTKLPVVIYGHKHDLVVDFTAETANVNDGVNSVTGHWRTHMLTYVGKNQQQLQKFENNEGAFDGLFLIDWESKKVFRLVGDRLGSVKMQRLRQQPFGIGWLKKTRLFGEDIPLNYEDQVV